MGCSEIHFRAFMVARRRSDSTKRVTVYRQSFDIQYAAADTFKRFFRLADTKFKICALYLIRIETTDGVTCTERNKIYKVY